MIEEKQSLELNLKSCERIRKKQTSEIQQLNKIQQHKSSIADKKTFNEENSIRQRNSTINKELLNYLVATLRNTAYPGVENYTRYAMARLGLSSLTEVESLNPSFGPVINDILSFKYPLSISTCKKINRNKRSVFVAVISAPSNFEKRNIIRKTWKNHLKMVHRKNILGIAGFGFILGLPQNDVIQIIIEEESKMHGDIIQIGIPDFYRNLSLKVAGLLNWLFRRCAKIDFVLKVDDDVYVNVWNLVHFIQTYHKSKHSIFGVGDPIGGWPERGIVHHINQFKKRF